GFTHADEAETVAAHQNIVDAARAGDVTAFLKALGEHYAPVRRRIAEARANGEG
ncbi:GntR family transcriptional regulator, partial [Streptomyces sp. SID7499]|nr:GntR family transcriptional regulator [Streptomyces sp. SID7499]